MSKLRRASKLLAVLIIVSVFFTACEVPDISRFTEQSSEMTRGIRKGVKDTESLLRTATERNDLYSAETIIKIKADLRDYRKAMRPTVAALDALDAYLEALNALAQANKKSGENARAAVTSVSNLVNAVSGFTIGDTALNVATGLVTLAEQFRTAKDFKKRVTLAAEIVEGIRPELDENGKQRKDKNGQPIFHRSCTGDANERIITASKKIRGAAEEALTARPLTKEQRDTINTLSPAQKWDFLLSQGTLSKGQFETITAEAAVIDRYHCGVIDFIKFNVEDLREINRSVSQTMYTSAREKNRVVLDFHDSIKRNDGLVQKELERILSFQALVPQINQFVINGDNANALRTKITLKNILDSLFVLDPGIETAVFNEIRMCDTNCGEMLKVLQMSLRNCDESCRKNLENTITGITRLQFDTSVSHMQTILNDKASSLSAQNQMYLAELDRIQPSYDTVTAELNTMKSKDDQLDALLESSLAALDTWAETHANLRVAVNTKQPLTASKLASKVRELWTIINPQTD
ncbi:MAG TPA: hypothetical protein VFS77_16880 [Pyrinomonadaceae bacterium]|nr:hypothetical protein [Pyrinomonadaceae bacterium]